MGASDFRTSGRGRNVQEAFDNAIATAEAENIADHDEDEDGEYDDYGYSGTIAEKRGASLREYTMPKAKKGQKPDYHKVIDEAFNAAEGKQDSIDDKYGEVGYINLGNNTYIFFGTASA